MGIIISLLNPHWEVQERTFLADFPDPEAGLDRPFLVCGTLYPPVPTENDAAGVSQGDHSNKAT